MTPVSVTNKIICMGAFINYVSNFGGGGFEKWLFLLIITIIFAYDGGGELKKGPKIYLRSL